MYKVFFRLSDKGSVTLHEFEGDVLEFISKAIEQGFFIFKNGDTIAVMNWDHVVGVEFTELAG